MLFNQGNRGKYDILFKHVLRNKRIYDFEVRRWPLPGNEYLMWSVTGISSPNCTGSACY